MRPIVIQSPESCIDAVIARVGKKLVVGTPLAAGKPNHLLNALYGRAKATKPSTGCTVATRAS